MNSTGHVSIQGLNAMILVLLILLVLCVGVQDPDFAKVGHKSSRAIKGAPLQFLFVQFCLNCLWFGSCNIRGKYSWVNKHVKESDIIISYGAATEKCIPRYIAIFLWLDSDFVYLLSAIAVLWIEFVREVRWCWEESQPLPKMPVNASIDLSTCLINQKLQMVKRCIYSQEV